MRECPPSPKDQREDERPPCHIEVITPIFGGGAVARKNDRVTPIRPSSVRGQLRFFWRATRGSRFAFASQLKDEEGRIWGTTESPSKVCIEIQNVSRGKSDPCFNYLPGKNFPRTKDKHPGYALFPFQGNAKDALPPDECTSNVSFDLKITYPKALEYDVKASLWGWTNFGGIGSRTRRGCGALFCRQFAPPRSDPESIKKWYADHLKLFGVDASAKRSWPTLPSSLLIHPTNAADAMQAWSRVVGMMQTFRQGEHVGRYKGSGHPGRSIWPEPEAIRTATSSYKLHHRLPYIPDDAFPRAEFGLPIVFHFKGHDRGDPKDTELYPIWKENEKKRMASPIILRPMRCQDSRVLECVMHLNAPSPDEVVLKPVGKHFKISDPSLSGYRDSPLGPPAPGAFARSPNGSAIEGFLAFVQEKGNDFVEVK